MKEELPYIIAFAALFLVAALSFTIIHLHDENAELSEKIARFDMYYDEKYQASFKNKTIDGLAFGDYIAVWTEGHTITETLEICTHEYAHNNLKLVDP